MKRIARVSKRDKLAEKLLVKSLLPKWKLAMETKSSILTSTGRTLRLAGTSTGKPIIKDLDNVIKEFDEYGGDIKTLVKQIGRAGDTDVTNVLNYAFANKTWDVLNEVWINALLSNPKTHIINTTSNLVNIFIRPLEKMVGSRMATSLLENPAKVAKLRLEGQKAFSSYAGMRRYAIEALKYAKLSLKNDPEADTKISMILEITNQAMSGEISFPVALEKRLKVLSLSKDDIRKATDDISNMVSDSFIKNKEFIVSNSDSIWIVSGGFKEVITPIVSEFGIAENHILANSFIYKKNQVIGCDRNNDLFKDKGKIKAINNLNLGNDIIIIGDGFTDYEVYSEGVAKVFICYTENITRKSIVEKSSYTASSFNEAIDILNQF